LPHRLQSLTTKRVRKKKRMKKRMKRRKRWKRWNRVLILSSTPRCGV